MRLLLVKCQSHFNLMLLFQSAFFTCYSTIFMLLLFFVKCYGYYPFYCFSCKAVVAQIANTVTVTAPITTTTLLLLSLLMFYFLYCHCFCHNCHCAFAAPLSCHCCCHYIIVVLILSLLMSSLSVVAYATISTFGTVINCQNCYVTMTLSFLLSLLHFL